MNEEIKWSKKEVVERHHKDGNGYDLPHRTFKVNVYRWKNYRLEKEMYGENRLSYHLGASSPSAYSAPLYLCDWHGSYHVSFFKTIKDATLALQNVLSYGLYSSQRWQDPNEKYIWGLLSYSPKRDVDVDFDEYS